MIILGTTEEWRKFTSWSLLACSPWATLGVALGIALSVQGGM